MRRVVATILPLILVLAFAAPVAASRPDRTSYQSYWADTTHATSLDPFALGSYQTLTIRFASSVNRSAGESTTTNFVDIFAMGWENDTTGVFNNPWEAGYFFASTPADPTLGGVDPSLADAWVDSGPLTFVCYQGPCPSMPLQISVSARWVADGAQTVITAQPVDDIGAVSSLINRARPASVSIEFTGGSLDVPPIAVSSSISFQEQVYRAPSH
jgi:hypothetical protein